MATVAESLVKRQKARAERAERELIEEEIIAELPGDIPMPTIGNESAHAFFGKAGAWLSFLRGYGENWDSAAVLKSLERAGFKPLPLSLVQWDNYRRTVEPLACKDLPETKGRYELTDCDAIAPLYVVPEQYTGTISIAFYETPAGRVVKVMVPGPNTASIHARRKERLGDWYFECGTAALRYPESWHSIYADTESGQAIATISNHSRAYVDTLQGISGAIYWQPFTEQSEFPLTPSAFLRALQD